MDMDETTHPKLLEIRDLQVQFHTPEGTVHAVNGVSYDMWKAQSDLGGRSAVIVADGRNEQWFEEMRCCFETMSEPRHVAMRIGGEVVRDFYLIHATGFKGFPPDKRAEFR